MGRKAHSALPQDAKHLWLQRKESYPLRHARPRLASLADLQGILARLKTYFDDAAAFGIEAQMISGRMNDALCALVDRGLHSADFSVGHWRGWYHTDGRLRGSSGHGN